MSMEELDFRMVQSVFEALGPLHMLLLDCWLEWGVSSMDEQGRGSWISSQRILSKGGFSVEVDLTSSLNSLLKKCL